MKIGVVLTTVKVTKVYYVSRYSLQTPDRTLQTPDRTKRLRTEKRAKKTDKHKKVKRKLSAEKKLAYKIDRCLSSDLEIKIAKVRVYKKLNTELKDITVADAIKNFKKNTKKAISINAEKIENKKIETLKRLRDNNPPNFTDEQIKKQIATEFVKLKSKIKKEKEDLRIAGILVPLGTGHVNIFKEHIKTRLLAIKDSLIIKKYHSKPKLTRLKRDKIKTKFLERINDLVDESIEKKQKNDKKLGHFIVVLKPLYTFFAKHIADAATKDKGKLTKFLKKIHSKNFKTEISDTIKEKIAEKEEGLIADMEEPEKVEFTEWVKDLQSSVDLIVKLQFEKLEIELKKILKNATKKDKDQLLRIYTKKFRDQMLIILWEDFSPPLDFPNYTKRFAEKFMDVWVEKED